jgi:hypothetical protein
MNEIHFNVITKDGSTYTLSAIDILTAYVTNIMRLSMDPESAQMPLRESAIRAEEALHWLNIATKVLNMPDAPA